MNSFNALHSAFRIFEFYLSFDLRHSAQTIVIYVGKKRNGKDVLLPKESHVSWSRDQNPDSWGDDVRVFIPDREFEDTEIWHYKVQSSDKSFQPIHIPPRDCIRKHFAHMEAGLIVAHLLQID